MTAPGPCPNCGGAPSCLEGAILGACRFRCGRCKMSGPRCTSREAAIAAWERMRGPVWRTDFDRMPDNGDEFYALIQSRARKVHYSDLLHLSDGQPGHWSDRYDEPLPDGLVIVGWYELPPLPEPPKEKPKAPGKKKAPAK